MSLLKGRGLQKNLLSSAGEQVLTAGSSPLGVVFKRIVMVPRATGRQSSK